MREDDTEMNRQLARPMTAVVVDDEAHGRQLVSHLAQTCGLFDVAGEFSDGDQFLRSVTLMKPDVIFLDIKMPKIDGLTAAREIMALDSLIVFVTAFEKHAVEAFQVQAFDYILKPIEKDRFAEVAQRAHQSVKRRRLERMVSEVGNGVSDIVVSSHKGEMDFPKIKIRDGDRLHYVDPRDVIWFEAANQYVQVHASSGSYLISSESLNSLEQKIDSDMFMRIHRSAIINVNFAHCIRVDAKGAYFVELNNGHRVRVSRGNHGVLKTIDFR